VTAPIWVAPKGPAFEEEEEEEEEPPSTNHADLMGAFETKSIDGYARLVVVTHTCDCEHSYNHQSINMQ
jgi:hypothetical protein